MFAGVVIVFIYTFVQPSYMPKGIVERVALPEFEVKELELQDRLRKAIPGSERDAAREQKIIDGMEWYKPQQKGEDK